MTRHRATQLRAEFHTGADRLRFMWFVTEPGRLPDLVADAEPELADLLVERHLEARDTTWMSLYGSDGVWLRADVHVCPWLDPRRDRTRRATTPAD